MDAVHQAQQPLDIGVCNQHNRVFECYCTQCYCMICPSCLMFDEHKGHNVCRIEQGARQVRAQINSSAKEGLLKFQKTQNILLDIRHTKLSIQQNRQNILKIAEQSFDKLLETIKTRKKQVLEELYTHFQQQLKIIDDGQNDWLSRQQISQKILQLQGSDDDIKLIEQARFIVQGLQKLSQPMQYKQIVLVEGIKNHLELGKHTFTLKQLKQALKSFVQKGGNIINQMKC